MSWYRRGLTILESVTYYEKTLEDCLKLDCCVRKGWWFRAKGEKAKASDGNGEIVERGGGFFI